MICPHCERDTDVVPSYRENAAPPAKTKAEKKNILLKDRFKACTDKCVQVIKSFRPLIRNPFVIGAIFIVLLAIVLCIPGYFIGTLDVVVYGAGLLVVALTMTAIGLLMIAIGGLILKRLGEIVKDSLGIE
jgi:hypothetical protein